MENFVLEEKLLYRRQFIIRPYFIERFKFWRKRKITNSIFLSTHPDLGCAHVKYKKKSLTLLGFILDPENPQYNDLDILHRLIQQVDTCIDLFELTENFGGRWILIFDDGDDRVLFNDTEGLRQVFYSKDDSGIWCASQPGIIAEELKLEMDEEALTFIKSPAFRSDDEYWWPGESSPFKQIKLLLPNHYLDLETGTCHRFWPNKKLEEISLKQCINTSSKILKGLIESAYNRYELALPITSGLDSRLLLASCKDIKNDVYYYTISFRNKNFPDVKVPNELLKKLGLKHNVLECFSLNFNKKFLTIYKKNVTLAHDKWGLIAQGLYKYYPQNKINLKGNVSETTRCMYASMRVRLKKGERITGQKMAEMVDMENNSYAIKYFNKWLKEIKNIPEKYNINVLDLFHWEIRTSSWQGISQLEWDIVHETFTPYNCRKYLATLLSVNEEYRKKPNCILHKKMIENLWAKTLMKPINPPPSIFNILIQIINHISSYIKFDFYNNIMFKENIIRVIKSNPILLQLFKSIEKILHSIKK